MLYGRTNEGDKRDERVEREEPIQRFTDVCRWLLWPPPCISDRKADMQDANYLLLSTHRHSNKGKSGRVAGASRSKNSMMQDRTCKKTTMHFVISSVLRESP